MECILCELIPFHTTQPDLKHNFQGAHYMTSQKPHRDLAGCSFPAQPQAATQFPTCLPWGWQCLEDVSPHLHLIHLAPPAAVPRAMSAPTFYPLCCAHAATTAPGVSEWKSLSFLCELILYRTARVQKGSFMCNKPILTELFK